MELRRRIWPTARQNMALGNLKSVQATLAFSKMYSRGFLEERLEETSVGRNFERDEFDKMFATRFTTKSDWVLRL